MRVAGEEWHGCGWRGRVGGRYIGDGSEAVSHLCEDWNGLQGRGLYIDLVLADGEAQAEVDLPFCRKVGLAHGDRVDMPDGTVAPLDRAQRDDQRVDELLEVVITVVDTLAMKWNESGSNLPQNPTNRAGKSGSLLVARVYTN